MNHDNIPQGGQSHGRDAGNDQNLSEGERNNSWDREVDKSKVRDQSHEDTDNKWANREEKSQENLRPMADEMDKAKEIASEQSSKTEGKIPQKFGCNFCGLKNHPTEECKKRNACELCGLNSHGAFECRREPIWNVGPELCAAQVPDQSFFYIEELIDPKAQKEKSSTAIITMTSGEITARQIEQEFKNILSPDYWRWNAKQVADNKFTMRFPNAKMVLEYSNFKLGMKNVDAQLMIEPWTSSLGAKGELQQAWFKVRGIPPDQRGTRTLAKVGGLVGKTVAIDESTRFKPEFVRIKIACRDIYAVPDSAESTLGMFIHDFFYELEEPERFGRAAQKVTINTESEAQQSPKRMKTSSSGFGSYHTDKAQTSGQGGGTSNVGKEADTSGKQQAGRNCWSAPSYINKHKASVEPVMPAEFSISEVEDGEVIPAATYEPSKDISDNEESGTSGEFANQVQQVFGEKQYEDKAVWHFSCATFVQDNPHEKSAGQSSVQITEIEEEKEIEEGRQRSQVGSLEACELNLKELCNPIEMIKAQREERRCSERLQQKLMEGRKDDRTDNSKKRNHEGLYKDDFQGRILEGVQVLLTCAHKVMARSNKATARRMLPPVEDDHKPEDQD